MYSRLINVDLDVNEPDSILSWTVVTLIVYEMTTGYTTLEVNEAYSCIQKAMVDSQVHAHYCDGFFHR